MRYGLDGLWIDNRWKRDTPQFQLVPRSRLSSGKMGTGSFPEVKRPESEHLLLVLPYEWVRAKFSSPFCTCVCRISLKCDGTSAENLFRVSAKRTSPIKSAVGVSSVDCWQPRCAASAVVMLDTPCSEVV